MGCSGIRATERHSYSCRRSMRRGPAPHTRRHSRREPAHRGQWRLVPAAACRTLAALLPQPCRTRKCPESLAATLPHHFRLLAEQEEEIDLSITDVDACVTAHPCCVRQYPQNRCGTVVASIYAGLRVRQPVRRGWGAAAASAASGSAGTVGGAREAPSYTRG